jgi:hypothetical protein
MGRKKVCMSMTRRAVLGVVVDVGGVGVGVGIVVGWEWVWLVVDMGVDLGIRAWN